MKNLIQHAFVCLLLLSFARTISAQCLELVWSDEFNINGAPDPANWSYDLGTGQGGWGNQEIQSYTNNPQNVRVENGRLILEASKGSGGGWTSGRIKTQGKKNFKYGKIQFRAKLPTGSGTWPALWMLGSNFTSVGWPACGEIDVMEHAGKNPGRVHGSLHSPSSFGGTVNTATTNVNDFATEFHDYEVSWDANRITFMVDGNAFYTYNPAIKNADTWPFNNEFFIIINLAMGGIFGSDDQFETGGLQNGVDPNLTSARMEVDYVRVYQQTNAISIAGETTVQSNVQGLKYTVPNLVGGTFNWTVPAGATITSGQGANTITVNWGNSTGNVAVEVVGQCGTYSAAIAVATVTTPQGPSYILDDFADNNFDRWTPEPGTGNSFTLMESNDELQVEYNITAPARNPRLTLMLNQPVDLSVYSKMRVRAKTNNPSKTVAMRIDLFDENGTATNASPVFRLEPLVDNGEYFVYEYDFTNDWQSSSPVAGAFTDSTKIKGLHLYINYSIFGAPGSDVVWFDFIEMVNPDATTSTIDLLPQNSVSVFPNPAQDLCTIQTAIEIGQPLQIQLFDSQGKRLQIQNWTPGSTSYSLNLRGYAAGVYFIQIHTDQGSVTQKLILEN